jgi:hypothetical protein
MLRFEQSNVKYCVQELLSLGNNNMKMWNIFQWLSMHSELQYGTQAEVIKLYSHNELVGYSLIENFEARTDKSVQHRDVTYQDLGVVHFITLEQHQNKGYATLLADAMYSDIIQPMLARHTHVHAFVTATGRAVPLMERTDIPPCHLVKQFYSDQSFKTKVIDYFTAQESGPKRN